MFLRLLTDVHWPGECRPGRVVNSILNFLLSPPLQFKPSYLRRNICAARMSRREAEEALGLMEEQLQSARAELATLTGKDKKALRSEKAKEIRDLERHCAFAKAALKDVDPAKSIDFAKLASLAEEQLAQVAKQEDRKDACHLARLNERNTHPAGLSGKVLRREKKELMKEFQDADRLANQLSRLASTDLHEHHDGDLLGDFADVTSHRVKPTNEYRVFSPPGLHSKIR